MTGPAIPQTRTVMEAGFTLREGIDEQFWRANNAATRPPPGNPARERRRPRQILPPACWPGRPA